MTLFQLLCLQRSEWLHICFMIIWYTLAFGFITFQMIQQLIGHLSLMKVTVQLPICLHCFETKCQCVANEYHYQNSLDEKYTTVNNSKTGSLDPKIFVNCLQAFGCSTHNTALQLQDCLLEWPMEYHIQCISIQCTGLDTLAIVQCSVVDTTPKGV